MKLSTRGHYGVQAMFDLAQHYGEGPIPLKSVAERQNLSEHYLEQLVGSLRKAGLVKSIRGAQGGYILARDPKEITVGDIIRVLEGPVAPVECVGEEMQESCNRLDVCITRLVWQRVKNTIDQVLDSITLADMLEEAEKLKQQGDFYMYYI